MLFTDSDTLIENITLLFNRGGFVDYSNENYTALNLRANSAITGINSEITVKSCIMMPDPDIFGSGNYGKGVQIWNLFGGGNILPIIEYK